MTMKRLLSPMAVFALYLLTAADVAAQSYYKWVDAQGVTHYGDQPPPAAKSHKIELRGGQAASAPVPTASAPMPSSGFEANERAYRTQACATARRNLEVLSSGAVVVTGGTMAAPAGIDQATKLTPEQRETAKAEAQRQVHELCEQG
jgi:hypothetical protein